MLSGTSLRIYIAFQSAKNIIAREEGQDLIEYALVVALIAFAAIAGMSTLAGDINTAFTDVGTLLVADV
jgi:pilus assembly protein Flp/PilA